VSIKDILVHVGSSPAAEERVWLTIQLANRFGAFVTGVLVVLGQHDRDFPTVLITLEDVILSCGLPVLVVPFAGRFGSVGENAAIAWSGKTWLPRK
jgi:hypothetical protein